MYARIEKGIVREIVPAITKKVAIERQVENEDGTTSKIVEEEERNLFHPHLFFVPCDEDVDIGFIFSEGEFIPPAPSNMTWDVIKELRDKALSKCDWTQLPDAQIPEIEREEWATYRQKLRDIPQDFSDANSVIWPTAPTE